MYYQCVLIVKKLTKIISAWIENFFFIKKRFFFKFTWNFKQISFSEKIQNCDQFVVGSSVCLIAMTNFKFMVLFGIGLLLNSNDSHVKCWKKFKILILDWRVSLLKWIFFLSPSIIYILKNKCGTIKCMVFCTNECFLQYLVPQKYIFISRWPL